MAVLSVAAFVLAACAALLGIGVFAGLLWLLWKLLKGLFRVLGRVLVFAKREVVAAVHVVGALLTAGVMIPLATVNFAILRVGAGKHYARALLDELKGVGVGLWRVALGNPLRLVGLGGVVDGLEGRLPDVMERAPRSRRGRRATFDGYDVIGTLPSGGSGAQLFVARPKSATHARFQRSGRSLPGEVVIKSFALEAGSTLPQIVRESRALEAASRLGLVLEHQLANDHFFYVMPYVKGEDLEHVTRALHARGTADGLADPELHLVLTYAIDLLDALQRFHSGGLWHKDVKPANVIVAKGRAHLVDFGLVTPLASALTLTTHGTEYYRDPEMVRLAMQGVKVHEVDGVRFDLYSAGAVLYSLLENSFPAHGNLSRFAKRAPEALRWIVQRAMAEMSSRYSSAAEMRADLAVLAAAANPFDVRPADLPSLQRAAAFAPGLPPPLAAVPPAPQPSPASFAFDDAPASAPFASPRRRRRRFVPVLAAAGALGAMFFGTAALRAAHSTHARRSVAQEIERRLARAPEKRPWTSLSEPERKLVDLAQGVADDLGSDAKPDAAAKAPAAADHGAPSAAPQEPAVTVAGAELPPRGRMLVLEDVTSGVDERVVALLRQKLAARAFRVVGDESDESNEAATDGTAKGESATDSVELLAAARHTLGLGHADEPETQVALQRFLDQSADLAALIVVSRAGEGTEHVYRVFVRPAPHPAAPRAGG